MANLNAQELSGGILPTFASCASGGDTVPVGGRTLVLVQNDDASGHTVTIAKQRDEVTVPGYGTLTTSDISQLIGAGDLGAFYPAPNVYGSGGRASVTYDDVTSTTIAVLRLV